MYNSALKPFSNLQYN